MKKIKVTEKILSEYKLQITEDNKFSHSKNKNLIPNLGNKRIPLSKLKALFNFKITIKKMGKILEFKQESFLKPCIECNVDL